MPDEFAKIKLKLYGLRHERNGAVRADVFAKKLASLIKGLRAADRHVNRAKSLNYLITGLEYGSALAVIDEVKSNNKVMGTPSSALVLQGVANQVHEGKGISRETPETLQKLSQN